jgi:hypothetical protein
MPHHTPKVICGRIHPPCMPPLPAGKGRRARPCPGARPPPPARRPLHRWRWRSGQRHWGLPLLPPCWRPAPRQPPRPWPSRLPAPPPTPMRCLVGLVARPSSPDVAPPLPPPTLTRPCRLWGRCPGAHRHARCCWECQAARPRGRRWGWKGLGAARPPARSRLPARPRQGPPRRRWATPQGARGAARRAAPGPPLPGEAPSPAARPTATSQSPAPSLPSSVR